MHRKFQSRPLDFARVFCFLGRIWGAFRICTVAIPDLRPAGWKRLKTAWNAPGNPAENAARRYCQRECVL